MTMEAIRLETMVVKDGMLEIPELNRLNLG